MKLRLLLILLSICYLKSYGQDSHPMIQRTLKAQKNRMKENVEIERMLVFSVDDKGEISKEGSLRNEIHYNAFGKPIRSSTYFPDMTIINENEYDKMGNLIKTLNKNASGKAMQTMVMLYDENNVLVKVSYYNSAGQLSSFKEISENQDGYFTTTYNLKKEITIKTISKLDSLSKIFTAKAITPDNKIIGEDIFKLTNDMRITEWSNTNNVLNKKSIKRFIYNKNSYEVEETTFDINNQPISKTVLIYNDKNLLVESIWFEPIDKMKQVSKYEYEYKSTGHNKN